MYSQDVRKIALKLYNQNTTLRYVAMIIGSSHSTIYRWLNFKTKQRKIQTKKLDKPKILNAIELYIKTHPLCTINDVRNILIETFNLTVSKELIRLTLMKTLNYTKKRTRYFSEPKDDHKKLQDFLEKRNRFVREGRIFVSIDETSFGRNYLPTQGYSKKGKRLYYRRPAARITTKSVLAAILVGNKPIYKIKEGSYNSKSFRDFLNDLNFPSKTVILMDNVSFHHSKIVKELIQNKNWDALYTPPYSPVFNPIEGVFSIVKRTFSKTMDIIKSFKSVTKDHINSFFNHSFKALTKFE